MIENVIELKNLTKDYGDFKLDNISLSIPKGGICGFIGQNGAGKTTTIKLILDVINKDSGEIKVFGEDMKNNGTALKERIGVVYDEMAFHDFLTPKQLNKIFKNIYKNWNEEEYFNYLKHFSLPTTKKCGDFSRGMRMKFQIAVAMSHNAELLIMDEPTSGLDPIVRSEILQIFQEYVMDENHTILFSSHITTDLEKIADEIVFINKGKIFLAGNKNDILENHKVIRCTKEDLDKINPFDIISRRSTSVCEELLVKNAAIKYSRLVCDPASLEDIIVFYVNKN